MANCHQRRVSLLIVAFFICLPCIAAIAALSLWPRLGAAVSSSSLGPSHHEHLALTHRQSNADELYFLTPGAASLRGRRPYQEDRLLCAPGIQVPYPASASAGLFGVFDGHLGDAASDFAARSIMERFVHHTSLRFMGSLNMTSMGLQWLQDALLAAISDVDADFGKIAAANDLKSGSTACLALQVRNRIFVANVGDSRAFVCSSCERQNFRNEGVKHFHAPISKHAPVRPSRGTRHHLSRRDGSLPRVNGQLAVSRSIGDYDFRKYGVVSEPEVSGWHQVSEKDKFLIVASDGIFEKLSPEEVCDVIHALGSGKDLTWLIDRLEKKSDAVIALPGTKDTSGQQSTGPFNQDARMLGGSDQRLLTSPPYKRTKKGKDSTVMTLMPLTQGAPVYAQILARILVELAFQAGSMDNLSAVIIPLRA